MVRCITGMDLQLSKTNTKIATESVSEKLAFPAASLACLQEISITFSSKGIMLPLKRWSCSYCMKQLSEHWVPCLETFVLLFQNKCPCLVETVFQMFASPLFGACIMHSHRNQSTWDLGVPRAGALIRWHQKYLIVCTGEICDIG